MPYFWSFEVLESWLPSGIWTTQLKEPKIMSDFELNKGRKNYPDEVEGAYFAARLAVTEYLKKIKKQSTVIIFREIGKDYKMPLGVWQIRENVRNALSSKPKEFSTLDFALLFLEKKLSVSMKKYKKKSVLINNFGKQKTLFDF